MKFSVDFAVEEKARGNFSIELSAEEFVQYIATNKEVLFAVMDFAKNDLAKVISDCGNAAAAVREPHVTMRKEPCTATRAEFQ